VVGGHQVGRTQPHPQWRAGAVHHRRRRHPTSDARRPGTPTAAAWAAHRPARRRSEDTRTRPASATRRDRRDTRPRRRSAAGTPGCCAESRGGAPRRSYESARTERTGYAGRRLSRRRAQPSGLRAGDDGRAVALCLRARDPLVAGHRARVRGGRCVSRGRRAAAP
jgi:hypothetical protein